MSRVDELVELIRGRIHSEFDGECHLTDTEAHAIADFLSEADQREKDARRSGIEEAACLMDRQALYFRKLSEDERCLSDLRWDSRSEAKETMVNYAERLERDAKGIRALQSEER